MEDPLWLARARRQLGVREVPGPASDKHILAYREHAKTPFGGDDGAVPWCAIFVNAMLELVGIRGTRSGMARSFLRYGTALPLDQIPLGAICVFSSNRGASSGHVGFAVGLAPKHVQLLGGNQDDAVSIAPFPRAKLIGVTWPVRPVPTGRLTVATGPVGKEVSDA